MITQNSAPEANASSSSSSSSAPAGDNAMQSINTIRDIIVGDQIRNITDRFNAFEKSLEAHYAELVNKLGSKFEAVQTLNKTEIENLDRRVKDKVEELQQKDSEIRQEIREGVKRLAALEESHEALKGALADQIRQMYEDFSKQVSEVTRLVKQQQEDLASQMVAKSDLSSLFNSLSGSLSTARKQ